MTDRYHFHLRDGDHVVNNVQGIVLSNLEAAIAEAVLAFREMIAEMIMNGAKIDGQKFEISDVGGSV